MEIPILSEFVQAGIVGVCIALIVALCFYVRLFVGAYKELGTEIRDLNKTIAELGADVRILTTRRKRPAVREISSKERKENAT